jgi:hypothetical protein
VESLATQTLVIFVIRTRRVPFFRGRPSVRLSLAAVGAVLPYTPLAHVAPATASVPRLPRRRTIPRDLRP